MVTTPPPAKKTPAPAAAAAPAAEKKSGIKTFKPGEVLFNQNDRAESLYIIQKGQIRLFVPKGRGFVDIAILRSGEVIGEMAYFDEASNKRSVSAAAIVTTDVVEISFNAFGKALQGLNPWFKTIVHTLADRLRKTNDKVKQLESNSVGFGKDGKVAEYVFFHSIDVVKMLSILYLIMKTHGELVNNRMQFHHDQLKLYGIEIFNIQEIKFEEFLPILKKVNLIDIGPDANGLQKIISVANIENLRVIMLFFNTQRLLGDEKKMKISPRCEKILVKLYQQLLPQQETFKGGFAEGNLTQVLAALKAEKQIVTEEDFADAIKAGLGDDIVVGSANQLTSKINFLKLQKLLPAIRLMNILTEINDTKSGTNKY
jgi:CRP-like cAMP-binding protein